MAIITISRGTMGGGTDFAQNLAGRLGFACLSREVVVGEAEKLMLPKRCSADNLEKATSVWERLTTDRRLYFAAVQTALAQACVRGDIVYHGHSGHLLLKGLPAVLKVRLIAPLPMRIKNLMKNKGLHYEAAREYVRTVDQERIRWTKFVYGVDWGDPANYDLVINLADIGIDLACEMVANIAQMQPYRNTPEVQKNLRDFALACRVKLALAESQELRNINFSATANDGDVAILGEIAGSTFPVKRGPQTEKEIQKIALAVKGVTQARAELRWFAQSSDA